MPDNNSIILNKNIILIFSKPITKEDFINKIRESAINMVAYLKSNGCSQLGHIKFIFTTNGEDYLQLSVLDMDQNPKIDGILKKTFEKIKLTLNVIAFGVKKEDVNNKVTEELTNLENYFRST